MSATQDASPATSLMDRPPAQTGSPATEKCVATGRGRGRASPGGFTGGVTGSIVTAGQVTPPTVSGTGSEDTSAGGVIEASYRTLP